MSLVLPFAVLISGLRERALIRLSYAIGVAVATLIPWQSPVACLFPLCMFLGFWAAPVGVIVAIVGMIRCRNRKRAFLIPLTLNLVLLLATFGVIAIGAILVVGN